MKMPILAIVSLLFAGTGVATAQQEDLAFDDNTQPAVQQTPQSVQPPSAAPIQQPPAPPAQPPPVPQGQVQPQTQAPQVGSPGETSGSGQWVYTSQYGWVWVPYGTQYTNEGTTDDSPYEYVYAPDYGWSWLAAPWVWGWGPYPYFGVGGPWAFGWYRGLYRGGWGWGHYRGGGAGWVGRGVAFRGGGFVHGTEFHGGGFAHSVGPARAGYRSTGGAYRGSYGGVHAGAVAHPSGRSYGTPAAGGGFHGGGFHGGGGHGGGHR